MEPIKLSIGLPVYNGEKFICEALDSILKQSYQDFVLIIVDNHSNDSTEEICKAYEKNDKRIIYRRNDKNIGAAPNFNITFKESNSEYFKWAAYDDFIHPNYLKKCLEKIESDKTIVICHSKTLRVNEKNKIIGSYLNSDAWASSSPSLRYREAILAKHACQQIFGIIRSSELRNSKLIGPFVGSDRALLAEISLQGRILELPEALFYRRFHLNTSIQKFPDARKRTQWFDTSKVGNRYYPSLTLFFEYFNSIIKSDLFLTERMKCINYLLVWFLRHWRDLGSDVRNFIRS